MKKIIYIFPILLCVVSCYKDLSTPAKGTYPEIELTLSDEGESLTIGYGETLHLQASAVQEGVADEILKYSWKIGLYTNSGYDGMTEISDGRQLDYQIVNSPSGDPYCLALTVTNSEDGYSRTKVWKLYVSSTLGDGLLVAHSKDGGAHSILSLLSAAPLTYGYTSDQPRVVDDVYGLANSGRKIEGKVDHLLTRMTTYLEKPKPKSYSDYRVMVASADTLRMLDPLQYEETEVNSQMFSGNISFSAYETDGLFNLAKCTSFAVMQGYLYGCSEIMDHTYSAVACPFTPRNVFTKRNTSAVLADQGYVVVLNPNDKCLYYAHGVFILQNGLSKLESPEAPSADFLSDKQAVAAGVLSENRNTFILRDTEGKYYALKLNINNNTAPSIVGLNLPGVEDAIGFAFCDNSNVVYYYTSDFIYAVVVDGTSATSRKLSFKPESGDEQITMVKHYAQAWWGVGSCTVDSPSDLYYYAFPISTNRMQIIVVTYNDASGEGKIYLKPYNVSTGLFSAFKDNGVYGGFGEISAVCSTLR